MKRILLTSVSFCLFGGAAFAQCTPDPAVAGDFVSCIGVDTDGFDSDANTVTVVVLEGAAVSTEDGDAVRNDGLGSAVVNFGTISANGDGDEAIQGEDGLTVINLGSISAADKGIQAGNNLSVGNAGTITSGDEGIEGGDEAIIINQGTITAFEDGVQVGESAYVENGGSILSTGDDGDGVDIDSGVVQNFGAIRTNAASGAGIDVDPSELGLEIINAVGAEIAGGIGILVDPENQVGQSVTNAGTITGLSGTAIDLGGGADAVMLEGGTVFGDILLGDGDDLFEMMGDGSSLMAALVNGGAGADTATFTDFNFADLVDTGVMSETVNLDFGAFGPVAFTSFELFNFADVQGLTRADFEQVAPVPLPAAGLLLIGAFGLMGAVGRRKV